MKFAILVLVSTFGLAAPATGFDLIKDGVSYRCEPSAPKNPGDALECSNKAYQGPFSQAQAIEICTGATSVAPALCALKAFSGPFSREQAVALCRGNGTEAAADCAIRAFSGPYTRDEAVALCHGGNSELLMRTFDLLESSPQIQQQIHEAKFNSIE